ncbi:uncharacterized protein BX663DRAFT_126346 [Cokeromyces recurvatus]|uniref:uncharacterized protein n=1 Tax=Cokeromyces recurvatus TaxID=90255 RepID=UPI002220BCAD|nr:uncharacterized protein BX663DRAFT_126346 [Cokeromyces recurvatus]KAI7907052.1 hypothetical protein BX663DRAFT_126346 [Cokeromyces recurvatus]
MDSNSHNVLQFVSAAAQVFEIQDVEDMKGSESEDMSTNNSSTWDIPEPITAENNKAFLMHGKSAQIRELLAEAAGANIEKEDEKKEEFVILNDQSIEEKLKIVFHLPVKESLKGEWPCYIVQSAIVSGFMYLTEKYICFYASLPKNKLVFNKSGYLLLKKTGPMKATYERYYFDLNEDALTWFESSTDSYSPLGKIDLKSVISIKQSTRRRYGLRIVTMDKTWYLQTDTNAAMIEWTNALQKAIFRAKHGGNSLKITLPFEKILDIELTEAFEFQKFLKIRAVGIDDNFVMDEVCQTNKKGIEKKRGASFFNIGFVVLFCLFLKY